MNVACCGRRSLCCSLPLLASALATGGVVNAGSGVELDRFQKISTRYSRVLLAILKVLADFGLGSKKVLDSKNVIGSIKVIGSTKVRLRLNLLLLTAFLILRGERSRSSSEKEVDEASAADDASHDLDSGAVEPITFVELITLMEPITFL